MNKIKLILAFIVFSLLSTITFAATQELKIQYDTPYYNPSMIPVTEKKVLTGGVSQIQGLPRGMYGIWQVNGTLLESNDYTKYVRTSSDIWVLKKEGDVVTLMNPQNGATATINVTAVTDNTATFVRGLKSNNRKDSEQVTLTLKGDTFYGTDLIVNETTTYGITMITTARYKIRGTRISGTSIYQEDSAVRFNF